MKTYYIIILSSFFCISISAQNKYILPDMMKTIDGEKVASVAEWEHIRRPELLSLFSSEVYGITPKEILEVNYRIVAEDKNALNGLAHSKQVEFIFSKESRVLKALLIVYLPAQTKGKVPVFVGYNFDGNETIHPDNNIIDSPSSTLGIWDVKGERRGSDKESWPLELIISNGFGVATMCYSDIYPDKVGLIEKSILPLFDEYAETKNNSQSWQAIGAWAWGMSRIVDFLENEKEVDQDKIIAIGHSRLGKATLWAGAQDSRFSVVISNNSGCGGAALFRRRDGETVADINQSFPHWFNKRFRQYNDMEENLPIDQHELIALMAPRPVYIASAEEDLWADPAGEYLAGLNANPAYSLYGLTGMPHTEMPALDKPLLTGHIGYHIRTGKHDITPYDWEQYINFIKLRLNM